MGLFILFANVNFVPGKYQDWQDAYDKLGEYVWHNEPTTRTYYFGIPVEYHFNHTATTKMFAFEIYDDRDGLFETHLKSSAMNDFLSTVPPTMTTGLDLQGYADKGGFLDRYGDKRECEVMVDCRILCQPGARTDTVSKLRHLAGAVTSNLPGTYTFLITECLDNDFGIRLFLRFQSWTAKVQHESHSEVLEFWLNAKDQIASMESQSYVPNRKGWLHRGEARAPAKL